MTRRRSNRVPLCVVLLGAWLLPAMAGAQSLADVARSEEARRKQVTRPSKVYTNQDLRRDHTTPTPSAQPAAPAVGGEMTSPEPSIADAASGQTPARDQAYWRDRIVAAREQLDRSQTFAAALQSRIDALTLDFVNRDDPAQRAVVEQNRLKALAELERVQREIAAQTKAIADIEEEARKAGVPAGWLR